MYKFQARMAMHGFRARPRGQAIILFVLFLIGMLGITGLALDGGRVALEKRRAQAAADAAALAGGLRVAYSSMRPDGTLTAADLQAVIEQALERAASNGYDNDGVQNTVTVTVEGPVEENLQQVYYVNVDIQSTIDPALIQLVYSGPLTVHVHAQSRARPYQSLAKGFTMVTTGDAEPGLQIGGNALVDVEGNIWVNTWTRINGALTLRVDTLYSVGEVSAVGAYTIDGTVREHVGTPITWPPLPEPACGPARGSVRGGGSYQPGTYRDIRISGRGNVTFEPGLYCVEGDLVITGGNVRGDGVMFYVPNGQVRLAGNGNIHLTAPTDLTDDAGNSWRGMLFYLPPTNTSGFNLKGTADFFLEGTVYVAGDASPVACSIAGTSGTLSLRAQFVCYSTKVLGTADMELHYPSTPYHLPPVLDLTR